MATVAVGIIVDNLMLFVFGKEPRSFPSMLATKPIPIVEGAGVYPLQLLIPVVGLLLALALHLLSRRTRHGAEHVHRFSRALDVWQHPFWKRWAVDDLDEYVEFARESGLRLGIEADYVPGREDRMATLLDEHEWDYVVGSVHFIRDDAVDMRGEWDVWRTAGDPGKVWNAYFEALGEAARTGMFDVLAHPDLVKVWGDRVPDGDLRRFYDRAMDGIADSDVAIEVSTAGLRKPVGELYPARPFLEMCLEAGRPVALSSDAHLPDQVGFEYERAVEWLAQVGVGELAVFEGRNRRMEPIG